MDLSELVFADASLMVDLAMLARRLRTEGHQLRLRGARPHIRRLVEITGLASLDGICVEGAPEELNRPPQRTASCATPGAPPRAVTTPGCGGAASWATASRGVPAGPGAFFAGAMGPAVPSRRLD